ncbi:MAG: amidohydrolase [Chromatiales bacterium]|jgi:predicted amidohydrolase YtcJ|nr:amidohydrolase [Chromatiales bacterium]
MITVYSAKKIITMNPRRPAVTHVAVRDGHILGAGELDELTGWGDYTLDEQFAEKIIMPGLVEGHCHSREGSAWDEVYVGFHDRMAPDRVMHGGLKDIDEVVEKLRCAEQALSDSDEPLMAWGLDPLFFHGRRMVAADLDRVSTTRPIFIIHQSGHIANVNGELLRRANITRDTNVMGLIKGPDGEPTGELQGPPLRAAVFRALGRDRSVTMGAPHALWRFARSAQLAGVTTATDLANELPEATVAGQVQVTSDDDYPLRIVPAFVGVSKPAEQGVEWVKSLVSRGNERLRYGLVKLHLDGSIQGFTARLKWPGYFNGADNGLWYIDPDELPNILRVYHSAGLQVHIHTNGDQAIEAAIDAIEQVLKEAPDADARFTLQHCQMAHDAHFKRMAKLGVCANLFSNHLYYWGDQHRALTMGPERAERMDAAASAQRLGVDYSIHSDAPVTHLGPLFTAWCAVNRMTSTGQVLGAGECISVTDALHAVTIGAAFTLKLDGEIGSIETGKRADFAILEDDPLSVAPALLKDVPVWGTVVGGRVFSCADIGVIA